MSDRYTFKINLDRLNEEIDKIIDGTLSEKPFKGQSQKTRIYELVCEYVRKNMDLKITKLFEDEENHGDL